MPGAVWNQRRNMVHCFSPFLPAGRSPLPWLHRVRTARDFSVTISSNMRHVRRRRHAFSGPAAIPAAFVGFHDVFIVFTMISLSFMPWMPAPAGRLTPGRQTRTANAMISSHGRTPDDVGWPARTGMAPGTEDVLLRIGCGVSCACHAGSRPGAGRHARHAPPARVAPRRPSAGAPPHQAGMGRVSWTSPSAVRDWKRSSASFRGA